MVVRGCIAVLHINPSYLPHRPVHGFLGARESVPCMAVGIVSISVWLMVMTNTQTTEHQDVCRNHSHLAKLTYVKVRVDNQGYQASWKVMEI